MSKIVSKIVATLVLAVALAACGVVDTLVDGFKHAKAVETTLERATGLKPQVGFNWSNGRLVTVTVTFPALYDAKPLRELAEIVRTAVVNEFKQTPGTVMIGFSVPGTAPGTTAQLREITATPPPPASPDRAAPPSPRRI
jgi:hypothetical protein